MLEKGEIYKMNMEQSICEDIGISFNKDCDIFWWMRKNYSHDQPCHGALKPRQEHFILSLKNTQEGVPIPKNILS